MKKRLIVTLLAVTLIAALCVSANAAISRTQQVFPLLSFNGTTANCSVSVYGDNDIIVELELKSGSAVVGSWSNSGKMYVYLSGSHSVISGKTYKLVASGTINGQAFHTSTSATCP